MYIFTIFFLVWYLKAIVNTISQVFQNNLLKEFNDWLRKVKGNNVKCHFLMWNRNLSLATPGKGAL